MPTFNLDANGFGAFYISVGQNSTNDTVNINVSSQFSGTITVDSIQGDGEIETVNLNLPEGWSVVLQGRTDYTSETPTYTDYSYTVVNAEGAEIGTLSMRSNNQGGDFMPCFAADTLILMADGSQCPCEKLRIGDLVATRDHGPQAIRWVGQRRLDWAQLSRNPNLRPIRVQAGALGPGLPAQDLVVSPQHRVLVSSSIVAAMFSAHEVLVAAKHLTAIDGIDIAEDAVEVTYCHFLMDRHEVVWSNGAATESLFTGAQALKGVGQAAHNEILALFPELANGARTKGARDFLTGRQGRELAQKHAATDTPLIH